MTHRTNFSFVDKKGVEEEGFHNNNSSCSKAHSKKDHLFALFSLLFLFSLSSVPIMHYHFQSVAFQGKCFY